MVVNKTTQSSVKEATPSLFDPGDVKVLGVHPLDFRMALSYFGINLLPLRSYFLRKNTILRTTIRLKSQNRRIFNSLV